VGCVNFKINFTEISTLKISPWQQVGGLRLTKGFTASCFDFALCNPYQSIIITNRRNEKSLFPARMCALPKMSSDFASAIPRLTLSRRRPVIAAGLIVMALLYPIITTTVTSQAGVYLNDPLLVDPSAGKRSATPRIESTVLTFIRYDLC
jgi:hypothetical protein